MKVDQATDGLDKVKQAAAGPEKVKQEASGPDKVEQAASRTRLNKRRPAWIYTKEQVGSCLLEKDVKRGSARGVMF